MVDVRGLDPRFAPSSRLSSVDFLTYSGEEVRRISCKNITNPNTFDSLLHPNTGGLYDPSLGPCDKLDLCGTCGLNYVHCPGHMGHIPLPLPVYHPIFFLSLYQLVRGSCWNCQRLLATPLDIKIFTSQLDLIESGLISEALSLECKKFGDNAEVADNGSVESLVEDLSKFVQKCKVNASVNLKLRTKNITELKHVMILNFIKSCGKWSKKCMYCDAPMRRVRQENRTRLFLKALAHKNAASWVTARRKELVRKQELLEEKKLANTNGGSTDIENVIASVSTEQCTKQSYISPLEVREHIRGLWENQPVLMSALFGGSVDSSPVDIFFLDVVPVPPSRFRPIAQVGDKKFENPQTANLHRALMDCIAIHDLMAEKTAQQEGKEKKSKLSFSERLQAAWVRLQTNVSCFMDSSIDKKGTAPNGIKQDQTLLFLCMIRSGYGQILTMHILEKKEGLFRKHMMGKRVDYAARSVISPDPYINMDEIGIPMVFATRLTYPQPVTHWNVKELRQAVINGPKQHPGATHVQNEDGSVILLNPSNLRQRTAIAKKLLTPSKDVSQGGATKKVFRHLKNGDVLLINRQPTLHKPSIMAHKARVLPGEKTLRLHYANCKSYNADFDGDEMNAHFPQNELARAEAYNIVSTHEQYLVPKDGTPLSGLIQDHVVSGVLMTLRGRLFNRSDYMQLVLSALPRFHGYFKTLPPCMWKPEMLWSGKQVVSTVLLNIIPANQDKLNLTSRTKIAPKEWGRGAVVDKMIERQRKKKKRTIDDMMTESEVVFCDGELMCGVLDKSQFGASQFGFIHSCHELYGGSVSNLLLSALGRLFTTFLQHRGFTLGVEDLLVTEQANQERHALIAEGRQSGPGAAAEAFGVDISVNKEVFSQKYESLHRSRDQTGIKTLDYFVKQKTDHYNNSINSVCVPAGLHKPFPSNCLQLMVQAGAKGSTVNCMQISCLLGQIELEGQRPPLMPSGRFLPSFLPYDTSPRAGGFVDGRFLTGIRPQEYFFHCMAGREGLVDTAVKTSRSGYLQRCLIKHLEGICVGYDLTVRDSDGSVVQFLYGEDGMDINKTRFLRSQQFPFLIGNYEAIKYKLDVKPALSHIDCRKVPKYQKKLDRWYSKYAHLRGDVKPYKTKFLDFHDKHLPEMIAQFPDQTRTKEQYYRTEAELKVIESWYAMSPMARESDWNKLSCSPVPVNARLRPDTHFGSVPEKLSAELELFIENHHLGPQNCFPPKTSPDQFRSLVHFKCLRALADPGEAVGLLAAQSIGEPSTQMTLNTFHFAGRGEMNVTLGIPRLREILMTASANIKTPAMDVPLHSTDQARLRGKELRKRFTRVHLSDVLEKVEVWESLSRRGAGHLSRCYKVRLSFLPYHYYQEEYVVTPQSILHYIEVSFLKKLVSAINKEIKLIKERRIKSVTVEEEAGGLTTGKRQAETEEGTPPDEDEDVLSDMDEGEGDATATKQRSKKQQQATYEGPGDSDEEVADSESEDLSDDDVPLVVDESRCDPVDEEPECEERGVVDRSVMDKDRLQRVLQSNRYLEDYRYDSVDELWCEMTLRFPSLDSKVMLTSVMEKLAPKSVVWETPKINQGYLSESTEPGEAGLLRLKTDGVNLQVLWNYPEVFDLTRTYTNNIHAMASTYGIEAACKSIIKEISGVFKVYGIAVDPRHLSLIADYMTFEGSYKPFNRIGIEGNSSPFQKMSFETTMHFLKNATITGESDAIKSPSACLVTGRVVRGGTGCFELMQTLI